MDNWYTYVVECADGTYYTGSAHDLNHRLQQHNDGAGAKYTRGRGPVKLVHYEVKADRSSALKRELQIKKLSRLEKQKLITQKSYVTIQSLAKST